MPTPLTVVIDGHDYPATKWGKTDQGEPLSLVWDQGFWGGLGEPILRSRNRSLVPLMMDVTSPPYIRLTPGFTSVALNVAALGNTLGTEIATYPIYWCRARASGVDYGYMFLKDRWWKFDLTTNPPVLTTNSPLTITNTIFGRPALFEGSWRIPQGATNNAATLTPAAGNHVAGELVTMSTTALNFANIQNGATAQLARGGQAGKLHAVDLSSDAITFLDDFFEAGDSTFPISDILSWQGELLVIKPNGPLRFSVQGDMLPLESLTVSQPNLSAYRGAMSYVHGPYAYWVDSGSLWRFFGDAGQPVNFEADPLFFNDSATLLDTTGLWNSVTAVGRWMYAGRATQIHQAYIEDDGVPRWLNVVVDLPFYAKPMIDHGPILRFIDATGRNLYSIALQADGSTRDSIGTSRAGTGLSAATSQIVLPRVAAAGAMRLTQLRKLWVLLESVANCSFSLLAERDGAAAAAVGAAITSSGLTERTATIGTSDTARDWRIRLTATPSGVSDSRVRAIGAEFHTLDIYRAHISLTPETVAGLSGGIKGSLQRLKALQGAQLVVITDPDRNETFNGYVTSVAETVVDEQGGEGVGYEVEVLIERALAPTQ